MTQKNIKAFMLCVLIFIFLFAFIAMPVKAQEVDVNSLKERAAALVKEGKMIDALPLLEKIVIFEPDNAENQFQLGAALLAETRVVKNQAEVKDLFARARKAFIKAKQLGHTEPKLDAMIKSIPEDGEIPAFTDNAETEKLMQEGESFFTQGNMDKAIEKYQKALQLDPRLYYAALFTGDAYVQKGDFDKAETWYQKAIQIDPTVETAYRYSATPLMKQKKFDQARDRYVEAYITNPFSQFAVAGLGQWAQAMNVHIAHPQIDIPASVETSGNGEINLTLGMGDKNDTDGSFAWTTYGISRALWQTGKDGLSDKFKKAYPNEKVYRHSLAEEYDALKTTVTVLKERMNDKKNPVKNLNPQLAILMKLYDAGLLESYILLARADKGIYEDYAGYLKQNRDKLRQYTVEYILTGGGK